MANHERIAADYELHLPEEIIQHIQSFMGGREAARTTLLSKSWYGAWSTRPTLNFDQYEFSGQYEFSEPSDDALYKLAKKNFDRYGFWERSDGAFYEFTRKTMQRYEDLNLKIRNFSLRMGEPRHYNHSLATELIVKPIKLGAVHLKIVIPTSRSSFVLPDEVLESKTLATLYVYGFTVNPQRRNKEATCSNLKSLNLFHVTVEGDVLGGLISECPLIEELTLHHTLVYKKVRIRSRSLERITIRIPTTILNAEFDVPNIRKLEFEGSPWPRLDFKATSCGEWKSDIHIYCYGYYLTPLWFSSLNRLVKMLSLSRLSISIDVRDPLAKSGDGYKYDGDGLAIPAVETLTLKGQAVNAFLDNIFLICRPQLIQQHCRLRDLMIEYLDELVCKRVVKEVNVEVFEKEFDEWRFLPWKTLLQASAKLNPRKRSTNKFPPWSTLFDAIAKVDNVRRRLVMFRPNKFRFQLRWGMEPSVPN